MAYDKELIVVKAGKPVEFILENNDLMPHNFVITLPGAMEEIGKMAEEKKQGERKADTQPSHPLADYAGEYEDPGYGVVKISLSEGKLKLDYNDIPGPLEHWHYDVFNVTRDESDHTLENTKAQFVSGLDGEIDALQIVLEPSVDAVVFKRLGDSELRDPKYLARFEGTYSLDGQNVIMALHGDVLTESLAGQSTYTLVPTRHDTFELKGLSGYKVRFRSDAKVVSGADFIQPNGVFTAARAK